VQRFLDVDQLARVLEGGGGPPLDHPPHHAVRQIGSSEERQLAKHV
jgi:hypothetical protein